MPKRIYISRIDSFWEGVERMYDLSDYKYRRRLIGRIEREESIVEFYWVQRYIPEYCPHCKEIIKHNFDIRYKYTEVIKK